MTERHDHSIDERAGDSPGAARLRQRMVRRIGWAAVIGPAVGAVAGAIIGAIAFGFATTGFWMVLTGAIVFATAAALLIGSYSSLESPDPSAEPSQVDDPVTDRPGLVREEQE